MVNNSRFNYNYKKINLKKIKIYLGKDNCKRSSKIGIKVYSKNQLKEIEKVVEKGP